MEVIVDRQGPTGGDCTAFCECHLIPESIVKFGEFVNYVLGMKKQYGEISVYESYSGGSWGREKFLIHYKHGVFENLESLDEETKSLRVRLISMVSGYGMANYRLALAEED